MDSEAAAQKRAVLAAKLEAEIAALRDAELTAQKLASQKTAELVFQTEAEIAAKRESELASHKEAELAQRQAHLMQKNIAEMAVQRQAQESEKARRLKRETEAAAEFALEEEKHKKEMATRRVFEIEQHKADLIAQRALEEEQHKALLAARWAQHEAQMKGDLAKWRTREEERQEAELVLQIKREAKLAVQVVEECRGAAIEAQQARNELLLQELAQLEANRRPSKSKEDTPSDHARKRSLQSTVRIKFSYPTNGPSQRGLERPRNLALNNPTTLRRLTPKSSVKTSPYSPSSSQSSLYDNAVPAVQKLSSVTSLRSSPMSKISGKSLPDVPSKINRLTQTGSSTSLLDSTRKQKYGKRALVYFNKERDHVKCTNTNRKESQLAAHCA
eukprot:Platyproteum_vivax@DN7674_c0_g1_i10.p1